MNLLQLGLVLVDYSLSTAGCHSNVACNIAALPSVLRQLWVMQERMKLETVSYNFQKCHFKCHFKIISGKNVFDRLKSLTDLWKQSHIMTHRSRDTATIHVPYGFGSFGTTSKVILDLVSGTAGFMMWTAYDILWETISHYRYQQFVKCLIN